MKSGNLISVLCTVPGSVFGDGEQNRQVIVTGWLYLEQKPYVTAHDNFCEGWPVHYEGCAIFSPDGDKLNLTQEAEDACLHHAIAHLRASKILPDQDELFYEMARI